MPPPSNGGTAAGLPKPMHIKPGGIEGARLVINAVEGFGKTTIGAFAPNSVILMARDETGFITLRRSNRVPDVPAYQLDDWTATIGLIKSLAGQKYGTVVLDALGGFERLCHEHVVATNCKGDWEVFMAYHRGFDMALPIWLQLLQALDTVRASGSHVIILSHAKLETVRDPMLSEDYQRYTAEVHAKTWGLTAKWADAVLFGKFVAGVDKKTGKPNGGKERIIYTEQSAAYVSKNRYGMAPQIELIDVEGHLIGPEGMWPTIWAAMNGQDAPVGGNDDQPPGM